MSDNPVDYSSRSALPSQRKKNKQATIDKELLINAIVGVGVKDPMWGERTGLVIFTGNQWNESWEWDRKKLHQLSIAQLKELYQQALDPPKTSPPTYETLNMSLSDWWSQKLDEQIYKYLVGDTTK